MELGWADQYGYEATVEDARGLNETFGADLCLDDYMLAELAEMDPDERADILDQFGLSPDDLPQGAGVFS